jgi:hypothetical protein
MNDKLLMRKLQIKQNIPETDKILNRGFQHLYDIDKILEINYVKSTTGTSLKNINLPYVLYMKRPYIFQNIH